jgi:hypothetical protein
VQCPPQDALLSSGLHSPTRREPRVDSIDGWNDAAAMESSDGPGLPFSPAPPLSRFPRFWRRLKTIVGIPGLTVVGAIATATQLGWHPCERHSASSTQVVVTGPIIQRPPKRDITMPSLRDGLISFLDRPGAKVQVNAIVDTEAMQFEYEIEKLLVSEGFQVLEPWNLELGGPPISGQNLVVIDGVFVIELGSDDGTRDWQRGPTIFPFGPSRPRSSERPIDAHHLSR